MTLSLIALAAFGLRRYGPDWMTRLQVARNVRRLILIETLSLDASRRLVLVRLDGAERLILLGDGNLLESAPPTQILNTEYIFCILPIYCATILILISGPKMCDGHSPRPC